MPAPLVKMLSATTPSRISVGSTLKYSPRPPQTPEIMRWSRERRRVLPEKALLFVMSSIVLRRRVPEHPDRYLSAPGGTLIAAPAARSGLACTRLGRVLILG